MRDMSVNAATVYQSASDINVVNHITNQSPVGLSWLATLLRTIQESVIVLDRDMHVICLNNMLGTFRENILHQHITTAIHQMAQNYYNPGRLSVAVDITKNTWMQQHFILHTFTGEDIECVASPVIEQSQLAGIIITACRNKTIQQPEILTSIIG